MTTIDINTIRRLLPHRYPMLLVDRVIEFIPDQSLRAIKNVTMNEPYFQGHFPDLPVMPGVMMVEAMAQAAALLFRVDENNKPSDDAVYYFAGIDKARFKRIVQPGDQLILDIKILRKKQGIWKFNGIATVDGDVCCTADFMCTYKDE